MNCLYKAAAVVNRGIIDFIDFREMSVKIGKDRKL